MCSSLYPHVKFIVIMGTVRKCKLELMPLSKHNIAKFMGWTTFPEPLGTHSTSKQSVLKPLQRF